jgi:hypothetical protein
VVVKNKSSHYFPVFTGAIWFVSLYLAVSNFFILCVHFAVSPIPESSPLSDRGADSVSAMCQQLSQGLSLLSSNDDFLTVTPRHVSCDITLEIYVQFLAAQFCCLLLPERKEWLYVCAWAHVFFVQSEVYQIQFLLLCGLLSCVTNLILYSR